MRRLVALLVLGALLVSAHAPAEGAAAAGESGRSWALMAEDKLNISASEKTGAAVGAAKVNTTAIGTHGQAKPSVDMAKEELHVTGAKAGEAVDAAKDFAVQARVTIYDAAGAAKNNTLERIDRGRGRAEPADKRHVDRGPVVVAGQSSFTKTQLIVAVSAPACTIAVMIGIAYCACRQTERHHQATEAGANQRSQATEAGQDRRQLELMRRDVDVEAGLAHIPTDSNGSPIPTNSRKSEKEVLPRIEVAVAAEKMTDATHI